MDKEDYKIISVILSEALSKDIDFDVESYCKKNSIILDIADMLSKVFQKIDSNFDSKVFLSNVKDFNK